MEIVMIVMNFNVLIRTSLSIKSTKAIDRNKYDMRSVITHPPTHSFSCSLQLRQNRETCIMRLVSEKLFTNFCAGVMLI
jgi:hypothetical protein